MLALLVAGTCPTRLMSSSSSYPEYLEAAPCSLSSHWDGVPGRLLADVHRSEPHQPKEWIRGNLRAAAVGLTAGVLLMTSTCAGARVRLCWVCDQAAVAFVLAQP